MCATEASAPDLTCSWPTWHCVTSSQLVSPCLSLSSPFCSTPNSTHISASSISSSLCHSKVNPHLFTFEVTRKIRDISSIPGAISHTLMYFSIHIVFSISNIAKISTLRNTKTNSTANHVAQNNHQSNSTSNHISANHNSVSVSNHSSSSSPIGWRPLVQAVVSLVSAWIFGCLGGLGPVTEWTAIRKSSTCIHWHRQHTIIPIFHTYYLTFGSYILPVLLIAINLTRIYCCLLTSPQIRSVVSTNQNHSTYIRYISSHS